MRHDVKSGSWCQKCIMTSGWRKNCVMTSKRHNDLNMLYNTREKHQRGEGLQSLIVLFKDVFDGTYQNDFIRSISGMGIWVSMMTSSAYVYINVWTMSDRTTPSNGRGFAISESLVCLFLGSELTWPNSLLISIFCTSLVRLYKRRPMTGSFTN